MCTITSSMHVHGIHKRVGTRVNYYFQGESEVRRLDILLSHLRGFVTGSEAAQLITYVM